MVTYRWTVHVESKSGGKHWSWAAKITTGLLWNIAPSVIEPLSDLISNVHTWEQRTELYPSSHLTLNMKGNMGVSQKKVIFPLRFLFSVFYNYKCIPTFSSVYILHYRKFIEVYLNHKYSKTHFFVLFAFLHWLRLLGSSSASPSLSLRIGLTMQHYGNKLFH